MSKIHFTPEQEQVIFAKNCTTLVSAAAGSGKTAVLVQRIIEKLIDKDTPGDINRLLVVTFTKAAAAEMRERIGKRLNEYLTKPEYAANEHLQKQVLLLKNAQITTIHSFCMSVLKEFFYELDIDPTFRVAEESELTLLKADVMEELLEDCYEKGEENFLRLAECVGGKTDQGLEELLLKLYKFAQSAPFPESWLATISKKLEEQETMQDLPEDGDIVRYIKEQTDMILRESREVLKAAMEMCQAPQGPSVYMDALEADEKLLDDLGTKKTYKELKEAFETLAYQDLSRKKCDTTKEKKDQVKGLRDVYKNLLNKLKSDYFFAEEEQMCADMAAMVPLMQTLIVLCAEYGKRFSEKKADRGLVDYNDLEHLTVKLLVKETEDGYEATETAIRLRKRFDEIMIDECQDSNEIQELVLSVISGEAEGRPNRFMVGDVKQSIYKFRMAKPELFMEKYDTYKKYAPGEEYCKIILGRNFRSRRAVITPVNEVFACLMQKEFGGIEYDEEAALHPGATYPWDAEGCKEKDAYIAEFLLTEAKDDSEEDEDLDKTAKEAMAVGGRIRSLIDSGMPIYDGEETDEAGNVVRKFHPVDYRDIMILFRSNGCAPVFSEVFSELGIPSVVEKQNRYFDAQEVNVVLNMLRVIDNPRQDIPLVSVLRSEMVGMTEEELALVRIEAKEKEKEQGKAEGKNRPYRFSFYEAICIFLARTEEGTAVTAENVFFESGLEKVRLFLAQLEQLRKLSRYAGVPEVLEELYRLTDYPAFVRVKPGGLRRAENLAMLVGKAKSYEEGSYSGIFDFIRYIERLTKYETEIGEAQIDSGENAVRMLSIHKSKGLEAPVVIVAGLAKQFNTKDMTANLVLHPELGMGMEYRDEVLRVKAPTLYKKVIAGHLNYDMLSEELRVLYVALTRAREKLILSAAVGSSEKFFDGVNNVVLQEGRAGYSSLLQAHSLLDFLKLPLGQCLAAGSIRLVGKEEAQADTEDAVLTEEAVRQNNRECYDALIGLPRDEVQDEGLDEEIRRRECYVYPYPVCKGKMKLSVSELKKAAYQDEVQEELFPESSPEKTVPHFITGKVEEGVSGSERGTLYHRVMECLDFCAAYDTTEAVREQLQNLIDRGRIRKDALQLISVEKIAGFFRSELGMRMCLAAKEGRLKKEQPFVIGIPYEEVYKEEDITDSGETVMVQGIIDAYFEEDGQLVLMDYKTDSVKEDVKEELTKRYKAQLMYYGMALSQMTGMPVKEKMIYAFTNGEAFCVE